MGVGTQIQLAVFQDYLGRLAFSLIFRDMLLLKNQIPFQVLMLLISLRYDECEGKEAVNRFLYHSIWVPVESQQVQDKQRPEWQLEPLHLLEAFHEVLDWDSTPQTTIDIPYEHDDSVEWMTPKITFCLATDLKAKGIHFRPSSNKSLRVIKFNSFPFYGQLELPCWFVSNFSKVFFLNMIAYELCPDNFDKTTVMSYLTFMKSLIQSAADVKELREKKILSMPLTSDGKVVRLFGDLDTCEGDAAAYIFMEVNQRVQKHCDSKAKTWMAQLIHIYFSSPWSIIAWLAGLVLLIWTFLQTYFTVTPRN